tara:strand:- start:303 stop:623 length:321 start_codon:yes stop_codon:yes gene_type:complete
MKVKIMVFDGPPQPLNKDVVLTSTTAIHADRNAVIFECLGEIVAGKLCPLVRVEDFRRTIAAQSVIKRMDTKIRLKRVLKTRQDRIRRLYQSMTTTRYINPRAIGI